MFAFIFKEIFVALVNQVLGRIIDHVLSMRY